MNAELFIARRLFLSKDNKKQLSTRVVNLAVLAISLGIAVIILSFSILTGFQNEIEAKVDGFAAHAQILNLDSNNSYQSMPVTKNPTLVSQLKEIPEIAHVQSFATKPGIIKVGEEIQGIVSKGITKNFDWSFFEHNKVEGERIHLGTEKASTEAWISEQQAQLLKLKLGDKFLMYFLNDGEKIPRMRQFTLVGIYKTGLEEFDRSFMLVDIRQVQRLNGWNENQISGYEIFVKDLDTLPNVISQANNLLLLNIDQDNTLLQIIDIKEKYASIFDWLAILDANSILILVLMIAVAGFNMVSGLLVIILERTQMIGILKALGASNLNLKKVFLYLCTFIISRGLLYGNLVGIGICLIQQHFKLIPLDSSSYFIDAVPIYMDWLNILLLNLYTFVVIVLMLILPTVIIGKISPEKTIRFD